LEKEAPAWCHAVDARGIGECPEKQIAECDRSDTLSDSLSPNLGRQTFICCIRAWPGKFDGPERQLHLFGLSFDEVSAHVVHSDASGGTVESGDQGHYFYTG